MDNVTHTLIGVTLAQAFRREREGSAAIVALAVASNLPDIDALVLLTGDPAAVTLRRTFGHSLFLLPIGCLLLALALRRWSPAIRERIAPLRLFGLVAAGAGTHLFFDLVNSFGVVLLWPVSLWRPELALVFIIDLVLTGLVALPTLLVLATRGRLDPTRLARAALVGVAVYLGVCGAGRALAYGGLARISHRSSAATADRAAGFRYVFPEPLGPHRWRGVVASGDGYDLYLVRPFTGEATRVRRVTTQASDEAVRRARASPLGQRLERFFKAPVWDAEPEITGTTRVCARDLRFESLVLDRGGVFRFCFRVDPVTGDVARAPD